MGTKGPLTPGRTGTGRLIRSSIPWEPQHPLDPAIIMSVTLTSTLETSYSLQCPLPIRRKRICVLMRMLLEIHHEFLAKV